MLYLPNPKTPNGYQNAGTAASIVSHSEKGIISNRVDFSFTVPIEIKTVDSQIK